MISKDFWGQSLHIDIHDCNNKQFSIEKLQLFCKKLCKEIGMKAYGPAMVERFGTGDLEGNSVLQFIETSSIAIHTDETYNRVFLDIFSCKTFDKDQASKFSEQFFEGKTKHTTNLNRY